MYFKKTLITLFIVIAAFIVYIQLKDRINRHNKFRFDVPLSEMVDSLKVTQEYMLSTFATEVTNFYWKPEKKLFINSNQVGYIEGNEFVYTVYQDSILNDDVALEKYVKAILFLRNQNIYSAYIVRGTNIVSFDYTPDQSNLRGRIRSIILGEENDLSNMNFEGHEVLQEYPPLYLIRYTN
ncbi:MAG: hypothetical protein ED557_11930 [Balneola sp.]|nr:MAG: hypothetical protein ED557_11930 [Balneola sp.]